jgi:hydroxyethylthiazole kinase-like sugar kinase family protein
MPSLLGQKSNQVSTNGELGKLAFLDYVGIDANLGAAPTIASATTIQPRTPVVFVSGTTDVVTINPPVEMVGGGQITIIPTGLWSTTTAGNIALATTAVVSKALIMTYDKATDKWYPSY